MITEVRTKGATRDPAIRYSYPAPPPSKNAAPQQARGTPRPRTAKTNVRKPKRGDARRWARAGSGFGAVSNVRARRRRVAGPPFAAFWVVSFFPPRGEAHFSLIFPLASFLLFFYPFWRAGGVAMLRMCRRLAMKYADLELTTRGEFPHGMKEPGFVKKLDQNIPWYFSTYRSMYHWPITGDNWSDLNEAEKRHDLHMFYTLAWWKLGEGSL
ncbi:hypothetical protein TCSYLVIO_003354 [Trypanosoma cruzi]|nr:hypothetical protein TCSYLVIO_003354 [Trypanosoma cruzi]